MKDTFRYFIRKNFPEIGDMSNEEIDQTGVEFHIHLDTKLNDEQKKQVLPKSAVDVVMNSEHPFKTNGFEPAYVLHFTQWVKEEANRCGNLKVQFMVNCKCGEEMTNDQLIKKTNKYYCHKCNNEITSIGKSSNA